MVAPGTCTLTCCNRLCCRSVIIMRKQQPREHRKAHGQKRRVREGRTVNCAICTVFLRHIPTIERIPDMTATALLGVEYNCTESTLPIPQHTDTCDPAVQGVVALRVQGNINSSPSFGRKPYRNERAIQHVPQVHTSRSASPRRTVNPCTIVPPTIPTSTRYAHKFTPGKNSRYVQRSHASRHDRQ